MNLETVNYYKSIGMNVPDQMFEPELPQGQKVSDNTSNAGSAFIKFIMTLVIIGVFIVSFPFIFCIAGMMMLSLTGSVEVGIVFGIAVFIAFVLIVLKITKKSNKSQ